MIVRPQNPQKLKKKLTGQQLVLYGTGGLGLKIAEWCDENEIQYVLADRDAIRKKQELKKDVILPMEILNYYPEANIVISSIIYYNDIFKALRNMGIKTEHILSYQLFIPAQITWKDLEYNTAWGMNVERVQQIAQWIPDEKIAVADYGAGKLTLKKFLGSKVEYIPIDYLRRTDDTILCDFDMDEYPPIIADVSVCTATLIFLKKGKTLLKNICEKTKRYLILSYVVLEKFPDVKGRRASGYQSDFTEEELQIFMKKEGFELKEKKADPANTIDTLYLFYKKDSEE